MAKISSGESIKIKSKPVSIKTPNRAIMITTVTVTRKDTLNDTKLIVIEEK